ncbi:MAG: tRNA pseudouridine(38-40) synthase TruA [Phytoplasma sp.]|uniref:tRNA pseudouridine(38-40) synthase TruA n=1 Tax=Phytoplasma sp. TaxID=2155 RepID=UPI002B405269|nr:tRNA pseudouridine(38-40) synthase TruA [Phytoplasma sp.]WRH06925.1 MAG: tRNA pseudouridine(38-40) synthase TruA [Phytoplasma sp.]
MKTFNFKLTLSYDGTNYYGYQRQNNVITIQSVLELSLFKITKQKIKTIAASRTDKGVHAKEQIINFKTSFWIEPDSLKRALNKIFPNDIQVLDIEHVDSFFHARYDSKSKIYQYVFSKHKLNPFNYRFQVYFENLDFFLIEQAMLLLTGEKDFALFTSNKDSKKKTIKLIYEVYLRENQNQFILFFHGKGFLKQMILFLVGFLILIGQRKKTLIDLKNMFNIEENKKLSFIAPANGLCLKKIFY